ncbi:aminobenzoyl-glutamate transporter [Pontibacillus halophilus JSM 076056 = DSM 19796]|uniref:Aminobenzoyl-glutamate transporter n=1 Tax=Pontibacillus halophilus JSM 076056 = DSM 19796 TaxID=1385510 RepID=A0A0A5GP85_9BACI|nr:AbgT family transporter [Pontibacillus halophilus]KGX93028.1 aminobenzoyl-glutamate transporter [Pontibacillus halophilus JSM 076056 = DSM 19796]
MSQLNTQVEPTKRKKPKFTQRILNGIENSGNKLPDVLTLFAIITGIILVASFIGGQFGLSAMNPATNEEVKAVNLLSPDGVRRMLTEMVNNFVSFPPLGLVLVVMLGVGLAESTGLVSAVMRRIVLATPEKLILPTIIVIAVVGNVAADAATIVLPPIAAMIFYNLGRNPIVGLVLAYAAVAGGFSANLLLSSLDVLLAGFTESSAHLIDDTYKANPAMNYYFMIASTVVLVPVTMFVTKRIVEPRLGTYQALQEVKAEDSSLKPEEKRGLRFAGVTSLIFVILLAVTVIPENGMLRNQETGELLNSPFMDALVGIMFLFFFLPAIAYGIGAKTIKTDKDVSSHLTKSMSGMGYYIVLTFVAAQMITYFGWSNLGTILSIKGAGWLQDIGLTGLPLLIGFILLSAFINLVVASSSAKWAILGPVFVPMLMLLDYSPAFTQMAYRVGDSITNMITPMLAYFAIVLTFAKKYDKNIGVGTLISALLPYSIAYALFWIVLFAIWYFLGLPLGPGAYIRL